MQGGAEAAEGAENGEEGGRGARRGWRMGAGRIEARGGRADEGMEGRGHRQGQQGRREGAAKGRVKAEPP